MLDHLTATGAGGAGLNFTGTIATISFFTAASDHDGIIATGSIGALTDSVISGSATYGYGLYLNLTGLSLIEANTISGNYVGAWLTGSGIVFGNADLSKGRGNYVFGNTYEAIFARGAAIVGNSVHNNTGYYDSVSINQGASFRYNLLYANTNGIDDSSTADVVGNRIFGNVGYGLLLDNNNIAVNQNTLYSNGVSLS